MVKESWNEEIITEIEQNLNNQKQKYEDYERTALEKHNKMKQEFNLKLGKLNTKLFTIFINGKMVYRNESWGKQNPNTINLPENILKKGLSLMTNRGPDFEKLKGKGIEKKFLTWLTQKMESKLPRCKFAIKEEMESSKFGIF